LGVAEPQIQQELPVLAETVAIRLLLGLAFLQPQLVAAVVAITLVLMVFQVALVVVVVVVMTLAQPPLALALLVRDLLAEQAQALALSSEVLAVVEVLPQLV
jgi:hypothetical protein